MMNKIIIESKTYGTHEILLDDEDCDRVDRFGSWHLAVDRRAKKRGIERYNIKCHKTGKWFWLKRFILGITDPHLSVCHVNGDKLDFRRSNLLIYDPFGGWRTNNGVNYSANYYYPSIRKFGPPVTFSVPRGFDGSSRKTLFKGAMVERYDKEKSHKVMAVELCARGLTDEAVSKVLAHRGFKTENGKPFSRSQIVGWTRLRKSRE